MLNIFMKMQQKNFQSVGQIYETLDKFMDSWTNLWKRTLNSELLDKN